MYRKIYVALIELIVVVVEVLGYGAGAVWCATQVLCFVVHNLGCSMFITVGEHRIVIRCYGTPVVCQCSSVLSENIIRSRWTIVCVATYPVLYIRNIIYVGVARCVLFCVRALLGTD